MPKFTGQEEKSEKSFYFSYILLVWGGVMLKLIINKSRTEAPQPLTEQIYSENWNHGEGPSKMCITCNLDNNWFNDAP